MHSGDESAVCSVVEWGVACPSFGKAEKELTEEEKKIDSTWEAPLSL